ncbi:MAG: hypothetical protein Q8O25_03790 [Sulfurisoma sp.]|nr:hypothetical protein [Sulfurisoma sp.]
MGGQIFLGRPYVEHHDIAALFKRKGGLKVRRFIAATSGAYHAELLGLG